MTLAVGWTLNTNTTATTKLACFTYKMIYFIRNRNFGSASSLDVDIYLWMLLSIPTEVKAEAKTTPQNSKKQMNNNIPTKTATKNNKTLVHKVMAICDDVMLSPTKSRCQR